MSAKTQLYLCNKQGVGVCTNVSANYMFRPLPVRPSSGYVQPEDDLTGRDRNMWLAETFVRTPTPCILHKYSYVLTDILYVFVYLVLRYTTGLPLLKMF